MKIVKGTERDIDELELLYNNLNDYLAVQTNYPGWIKGIYPIRETAVLGIEEGNLYVIKEGDNIIGSVILRQKPEPAYSNADWGVKLDYKDIIVIYTLAVHPDYLRKGIGKKLIEFIIQYSKELNIKAIRLDVYKENIPAISLYKKYGFQYIDTVDLGYGEYGLDEFELYQKLL